MQVNIQNDIPNIKVSVNQNEDGSITLYLTHELKKVLGDANPGDIVTIGNRDYIVLEHREGATSVITKDVVVDMVYGESGSYEESGIRRFCNTSFYQELCEAVGESNIIPHTVDLTADDGSGKGSSVKDNISVITNELYRRYRELLPAGKTHWTATPVTVLDNSYARYVCIVCSDGFLGWGGCDFSYGVRPFCVLNSSISI